MKPALPAALLLLASLASAGTGPDAEWSPSPAAVAAMRACASRPGADARSCLHDAMRAGGASSAALAFSAGLDGAGYLKRFQERGRVDVAHVRYPFRANANDGVLLVSASTAPVDVSSPGLIAPLDADPRMAPVRREQPQASIWATDPGNPGVKEHDGGDRVVFAFPVRTCHACADLATAFVAYDFGADGAFRGASLVGLLRAAAASVSGTVAGGKAFAAPLDGGLVFRLDPIPDGWTISVKDADGRDYCAMVTPPFRGPNALVLHASQLRGPGDGGLGRVRDFRCVRSSADYEAAKTALNETLWSAGRPPAGVAAARRELSRLTAAARPAELAVRDATLGGAAGDAAPPVAAMSFSFSLYPAPGEK